METGYSLSAPYICENWRQWIYFFSPKVLKKILKIFQIFTRARITAYEPRYNP